MSSIALDIDWSQANSNRDSITSYGDRPNTYEEASEYFRAHFLQVHRRKDVGDRAMYVVRQWQRPEFPLFTENRRLTAFPSALHVDAGKAAAFTLPWSCPLMNLQDVQATRSILAIVGEAIIRSYMESVGLS